MIHKEIRLTIEGSMNEKQDNKLVFLSDKPVVDDQLGTHKHLAELLVRIVHSESDNPLVIGLFGSWGTGKSSVAEMYATLAENIGIKNIYVDTWMFVNARERFGAGLLKILASSLITDNLAQELIDQIDQRKETWKTEYFLEKFTKTLLLALTFILFGLVLLSVFFVGWDAEIKLNLLIFLISVFVVQGLLNWVLPRVMITSESRTIDESYNKVEHFQNCFNTIMSETKYETISVVVDNLDRIEPVDALEIIRMLKTFVVEKSLNEKRFVLMVAKHDTVVKNTIVE